MPNHVYRIWIGFYLAAASQRVIARTDHVTLGTECVDLSVFLFRVIPINPLRDATCGSCN